MVTQEESATVSEVFGLATLVDLERRVVVCRTKSPPECRFNKAMHHPKFSNLHEAGQN